LGIVKSEKVRKARRTTRSQFALGGVRGKKEASDEEQESPTGSRARQNLLSWLLGCTSKTNLYIWEDQGGKPGGRLGSHTGDEHGKTGLFSARENRRGHNPGGRKKPQTGTKKCAKGERDPAEKSLHCSSGATKASPNHWGEKGKGQEKKGKKKKECGTENGKAPWSGGFAKGPDAGKMHQSKPHTMEREGDQKKDWARGKKEGKGAQ